MLPETDVQANKTNSKCSYLVVKIASLCNLNCSYCYMYNLGDKTYKNQPKVMPQNVMHSLLMKTFNHCVKHNIKSVGFGLHGGEPLLAGKEFFRKFVNSARDILGAGQIIPFFSVQTNAVLLTEDWCQLFEELDVHIAISLDGDKETNDKYRLDHKGVGSYDKIIAGLNVLQKFPQLNNKKGLLSVIDIQANPLTIYEHFKSLNIKWFDMLFPNATYDQFPPMPDHFGELSEDAPYGDWLIKMFDRWFQDKTPQRPRIRLFYDLVGQVMGSMSCTDLLGNSQNEILVIETNGGIEPVDVLKICGDGFTKQGVSVFSHEFDEVFDKDLISLYDNSHQLLCGKCLSCPLKDICGGGYLPHRYSKLNGFNNPSFYCKDLMKLITHIQNRVIEQLPQDLLTSANISSMTYEEAQEYVTEPENWVTSPYEEELKSFRKI